MSTQAKISLSEEEFIAKFQQLGASKLAKEIGINVRNVYDRRHNIERKLGVRLEPRTKQHFHEADYKPTQYPWRKELAVTDGVVFVASDFHCWPGAPSTIHRAIVKLAKELCPVAVVANGDVLDFARISRHPPIGWESRPTVQQEIETAQDRLHEISSVLKRGCRRIWTGGNHDFRFETYVATHCPDFAKVSGVHLHDHFPDWETCWSVWINNDVVVKHRYKGGIHATHNNTASAGKTTVTGHNHGAKVTPLSDYNGTRYGVDAGMVADVDGPQFVDYTEDNPKNWRSAFCILTFRAGRLCYPELVLKWDADHVEFRGEIIKV